MWRTGVLVLGTAQVIATSVTAVVLVLDARETAAERKAPVSSIEIH